MKVPHDPWTVIILSGVIWHEVWFYKPFFFLERILQQMKCMYIKFILAFLALISDLAGTTILE